MFLKIMAIWAFAMVLLIAFAVYRGIKSKKASDMKNKELETKKQENS